MQTVIRVTKALADPNRVMIIKMLEQREMCACEIVSALKLAQPTISKHLKQLVDANLIHTRRQGSWAYYRLVHAAELPPSHPAKDGLAFIKKHLNDDPAVQQNIALATQITPEKLNCPR